MTACAYFSRLTPHSSCSHSEIRPKTLAADSRCPRSCRSPADLPDRRIPGQVLAIRSRLSGMGRTRGSSACIALFMRFVRSPVLRLAHNRADFPGMPAGRPCPARLGVLTPSVLGSGTRNCRESVPPKLLLSDRSSMRTVRHGLEVEPEVVIDPHEEQSHTHKRQDGKAPATIHGARPPTRLFARPKQEAVHYPRPAFARGFTASWRGAAPSASTGMSRQLEDHGGEHAATGERPRSAGPRELPVVAGGREGQGRDRTRRDHDRTPRARSIPLPLARLASRIGIPAPCKRCIPRNSA